MDQPFVLTYKEDKKLAKMKEKTATTYTPPPDEYFERFKAMYNTNRDDAINLLKTERPVVAVNIVRFLFEKDDEQALIEMYKLKLFDPYLYWGYFMTKRYPLLFETFKKVMNYLHLECNLALIKLYPEHEDFIRKQMKIAAKNDAGAAWCDMMKAKGGSGRRRR